MHRIPKLPRDTLTALLGRLPEVNFCIDSKCHHSLRQHHLAHFKSTQVKHEIFHYCSHFDNATQSLAAIIDAPSRLQPVAQHFTSTTDTCKTQKPLSTPFPDPTTLQFS